MKVHGLSDWRGSFREGTGTISTPGSDALQAVPYTFASRFEGHAGACPEQLLAAAHAACFNHAFANICGAHQIVPTEIQTAAELTMGKDERGFPAVMGVHFVVKAQVSGIAEGDFQRFAEMAKAGCAISKALNVKLTVKATLGV